jgi:hypothetical protein
MAKFLDTQAISHELMILIKEAKEKIILVSPYLKVNSQIQERLKTRSKIGTLSEIVIVYGKSELKKTELDWIKEIEDLKVYEKNNLHAKCYINEEKAIICSMNLYDYSQQNNIEMGILISRQHDLDAYNQLIEEINNIKVNGTRIRFDGKMNDESKMKSTIESNASVEKQADVQIKLNPSQQLKFEILKQWRLEKSREEKCRAFQILTDNEIKSIVSKDRLDSTSIYEIIPKKSAIKYGEQIIARLQYIDYYIIGKVIKVLYQDNDNSYDRVKLKVSDTGEEKWFDTTQELPTLGSLVAAKINRTWFNEYFYLDDRTQ